MDKRKNRQDSGRANRRHAGRLTVDESAELCAQVARLGRAELPLSDGLRALSREHGSTRLGDVLLNIADALDSGSTIDEAMGSQQDRFPRHMRGLLIAGVRSGRLDDVLEQYVSHRYAASQRSREMWISLGYPGLLLAMTAAVLVFSNFFIVPDLAVLGAEFEGESTPTAEAYHTLSKNGALYFAISLACIVVGLIALRLLEGRGAWLQILTRIPLIGPLWRFGALAELAGLVGLLLEHRVPAPEALALSAASTDDANLAAACRRISAKVAGGVSLGEAVFTEKSFPRSVVPLMRWGDETGALPEAFQAASETFEGRTDVQLALVRAVVPPLAFIIVIAAVLSMVSIWYGQTLEIMRILSDLS